MSELKDTLHLRKVGQSFGNGLCRVVRWKSDEVKSAYYEEYELEKDSLESALEKYIGFFDKSQQELQEAMEEIEMLKKENFNRLHVNTCLNDKIAEL